MEFIRKVAAVCALSFLMAGSAQAVAQIGSFAFLKGCVIACNDKVKSLMPKYKTVKKQLNRYVVKPAIYMAPTIGGVAAQLNPVIGGVVAGFGLVGRNKNVFTKDVSALNKGLSICYNIFKTGLETGSSFALTRGLVNGNGLLIAAGAFGSFLRLGCKAADKGYLTGIYWAFKA